MPGWLTTTGSSLALVGSIVFCGTAMSQPVPPPPAPSALRTPVGCPELPPIEAVPVDDRTAARVPAATAPTALDRVDGSFDLAATIGDMRGILGEFEPIARFVTPSMGIEVEVLSDGLVAVDPAEFDRLSRLALETSEAYSDARVVELLACYRHRLVDRRELDGSTLRIYVPADSSTCFRRGRIAHVGPNGYAAACDASGLTLPALDLSMEVLGIEVAAASSEAAIVVSAGVPGGGTVAERELSFLLVHELYHHYDNALGLPPWSDSLVPYEQRAYYIERALRDHAHETGDDPPLAFRYVAS